MQMTQPLVLDDKVYRVPQYDWKKTKFLGQKWSKKLDYIYLFPEKYHTRPEELVKIHAKRKLTTPGPEHYDMIKNWSRRGGLDYNPQKGRQYRRDRETDVARHIRLTKKEKSPAPNHYKPRRQSRILGPINYEQPQM